MSLFLAGALLAGSIYSGEKSRKETRKASRVQSRMQSRQMQRERQQMLRESQLAQATGQQMAATTGVADSSGFKGSQSGMQASYLGNLAFSSQTETGAGRMQRFMNRAGRWDSAAQIAGAASNFTMAVTQSAAQGGG